MNRRDTVIALMALGAAPLELLAQRQGKAWRIGFLAVTGPENFPITVEPFRRGMRDLGYVEGKSYRLEIRSMDGKPERLAGSAAELVRLDLDLIVTTSSGAAQALQKASSSIPIVVGTANDPVGSGIIKSLARPGGNITGLSNLSVEISGKHVEFLRAAVPRLSHVAVLMNTEAMGNKASMLDRIQASAGAAGIKTMPLVATTPAEIEKAFGTFMGHRVDGLIVALGPFFLRRREQIAGLATKYRMPTLAGTRAFVEAGCLMSYGPNLADNFRRAATYVDKILRGARPGDLPFEQPTTLELVINRRTATALGIKLPQALLMRAHEVIE